MTTLADPNQLRELSAPVRNNYFYGKMLGVFQFEMEQAYFTRKRWLLNRLGLGSGVLCGLEVVVTEDGQRLWLKPGVAIDGLGREIIVPGPYCIDNPRQATDDCGHPDGPPIEGEGAVTILLCYHECEADPVPVLVGDCDSRNNCAPNTIRERFRLQIVAGLPSKLAGLTEEQCDAIFPDPPPSTDFDRRATVCETLMDACPAADTCVVLATVALPAADTDPLVIDECGYRTTVYSNSRLFDLLMCLSEKVGACCDHRLLRYVSGDAQQAIPGQALAAPVAVEVVDGDGTAVANETVTFTVRGGGGTVSPATIPSDASGRAEAAWTLGPNAGLNTLAASIAGQPELPLFALGVAAKVALPPVVLRMFPDPATVLRDGTNEFEEWVGRPLLAITFDREMLRNHMADGVALDKWLRVHQFIDNDRIIARPVALELVDTSDNFRGRAGFTALFAMRVAEPRQPARYIVQMHAEPGAITDTATPATTLDAEFRGTALPRADRDRIWDETTQKSHPRAVWNAIIDTAAVLPKSGDGAEGGEFHGWFEIGLQG